MKVIKIGNQIWSKRNLKVDHYRNGDKITEVQGSKEWSKQTTGAWCYYENKKTKKVGKLYNWYAVNDPRGLAPVGWHIPTVEEFMALLLIVKHNANYLRAEKINKEKNIETTTNDVSDFYSAYRSYNGQLDCLSDFAYYWSSDKLNKANAYGLYLHYNNKYVNLYSFFKENGFNIRLIKD